MGIGRVAWDEISRTGTGQVRSGCPRAGWRDWAKTRVTRGPERPLELPPPHSLHLLPAESCRQRKQPVTSLRGPALGSLCQNSPSNRRENPPLRFARAGRSFRPEGCAAKRMRLSTPEQGGSVWLAGGLAGWRAGGEGRDQR